MHSVGIEPTLLRTRALSVRLNRSAKSALVTYTLTDRGKAVRVAQWIARLPPKQKVAGSNPASDVGHFFWCDCHVIRQFC
jgi:hypothetical protein